MFVRSQRVQDHWNRSIRSKVLKNYVKIRIPRRGSGARTRKKNSAGFGTLISAFCPLLEKFNSDMHGWGLVGKRIWCRVRWCIICFDQTNFRVNQDRKHVPWTPGLVSKLRFSSLTSRKMNWSSSNVSHFNGRLISNPKMLIELKTTAWKKSSG